MAKFTLKQYQEMAERFNALSFYQKIMKLQKHSDIITLASDGNWWGVKAKDKDIEEQLYETETGFTIEQEWGSSEIHALIDLLEIGNTDI